jgi:hypothetical protein
MRELVNKPFSQFETVVLNDGVEFDDINDDVTEDVAEEPLVEEPVAEPIAVEPVAIEEPVAKEPAIEEPVVEEQRVLEEPVSVEEQVPVEEEPVLEEPAVEEASEDKEPAELISFYEEEKQESERHWGRWLLGGVIVLILLVGAAFGGYEYGRQQQVLIPDTVFVRDTVYMPELQDSAEVKEAEKTIINEMKTPTVAKEEPKEVSKAEPKAEPKKEELDQWSAKDERVRLGAYRIVGLSHEVTVLEGQTFYSICRAHLGPDMQCYVEVYNNLPRNPQIKTGQVLKIPKLELRKRRK